VSQLGIETTDELPTMRLLGRREPVISEHSEAENKHHHKDHCTIVRAKSRHCELLQLNFALSLTSKCGV
jgi:hypothetical protein